jgi:hypothetical protein
MQLPIKTSMPWLPRMARDQLSANQRSSLCAQWRARFGAWTTTWAQPASFAGLTYSAIVSASSQPSEPPSRARDAEVRIATKAGKPRKTRKTRKEDG